MSAKSIGAERYYGLNSISFECSSMILFAGDGYAIRFIVPCKLLANRSRKWLSWRPGMLQWEHR